MTARQEEEERNSEMAEEWRALGNVIDRLSFAISVIVLLSLCIWMMVKSSQPQMYSAHGDEDESAADADH